MHLRLWINLTREKESIRLNAGELARSAVLRNYMKNWSKFARSRIERAENERKSKVFRDRFLKMEGKRFRDRTIRLGELRYRYNQISRAVENRRKAKCLKSLQQVFIARKKTEFLLNGRRKLSLSRAISHWRAVASVSRNRKIGYQTVVLTSNERVIRDHFSRWLSLLHEKRNRLAVDNFYQMSLMKRSFSTLRNRVSACKMFRLKMQLSKEKEKR